MSAKTKDQLLKEVERLKRKVAKLEKQLHSPVEADRRIQMLASALEQSTNAIAILNTKGIVEYVNPKLLETYNLPKKKILGASWRTFLSKDSSLSEVLPQIKETLLKKGEMWRGEVCDKTAKGKTVWRQATIFPIKDAQGRIIHFVYISEDITERKMWLDVLKAEKEQAQKYLDIAGFIFVAINKKGDVILINKKGCNILGYKKEEEIIGKNWFDTFLPKEQVKQVKSVLRKLIRGEIEPVEYYENPVVTKNGEERMIAWHNTVVKNDAGKIIGTLSSGEDITERYRAAKELEKSEERFRSLVEHTTESFFCYECDPPIPINIPLDEQVKRFYEGVLVECNTIAAQLYGAAKPEELIGKKVKDFFGTTPGSLDTLFREFIENGYQTIDAEEEEILPDNTKRCFLKNGHSVFENGCLVRVWGTYRDITERKKAENLLRIQRDLSIAYSGAKNLEEVLDTLLDYALQMDEVDSGGVYLRDIKTGELNLLNHRGLPDEFVKVASHYDNDMPQTQLVMKGEPIHLHYMKLGIPLDEGHLKEPLKAISIIPMKHEDEVIGVLNLASHDVDEFSPATRGVAESIAGTAGEAIAHAQSEAAVQEINARMRAVMESAKDVIIFSLDRNCKYTSFNHAHFQEMRKVYGVDIEIGMSILECMNIPELRKKARESFDRILNGESFTEVQEQLGLGIFYEFMWSPIRNEKGSVTGIAAFIRDMTDRMKAQEALKESEEKYRMLITNIPYVTWISASDGTTTFISENVKDVYGFTQEEICKNGKELWFGRIHKEDKQTIEEAFAKLFEKNEIFDVEYRIRKPDGQWIWLHDKAVNTFQKEGVQYAYGVFSDISERRQIEEDLKEERDFAESLIETAQVIILVLDMEGGIISFNPYMEEISGYKLEEVQGKDWFSTFTPAEDSDRIRKLFKKAADDISTKGNVNAIVTKEGKKREIIWYDRTLKSAKGDPVGVLTVGQDVTESRQMEDRLRQAEKMEAVGQLAGGIAHDFNNQLAGIMGYGDLIREAAVNDPTLYRYADSIINCVRRSADLTAKLLAFSRKGKYLSIPVDIHRIVFEVVNLLQHSIDKKIELRQHLKASPPFTVGDPSQLQNAILNLALNARDAMPEGGNISFVTSIEHLDREYCDNSSYNITEGEYIKISVTDTGTGIDKKTIERIFEPFFTTKEEGKGTGMGLSAVYGTVKSHKGAINVYSEVGHGTTFNIYLPLVGETREVKPDTAGEEKTIKGTAHVLLVEDENILCDLAYKMLTDLGYEVSVCKDGSQAIEFYKHEWKNIDLVLLDMIMPGVGGKEAFLAMRHINPDIKVLLSSGYSVDGNAQSILDVGARGFIQKPFRKAELSKKVAEVLS